MAPLTALTPTRLRPAPIAAPPILTAPSGVQVHGIVRWALYLMVFSIPFEFPNRTVIPVEIPVITAAIFLLATLLQPRLAYARLPGPLGWFLGCLYAYVLAAAVNRTEYGGEVVRQVLVLFEGALVFWGASNLLRDDARVRVDPGGSVPSREKARWFTSITQAASARPSTSARAASRSPPTWSPCLPTSRSNALTSKSRFGSTP